MVKKRLKFMQGTLFLDVLVRLDYVRLGSVVVSSTIICISPNEALLKATHISITSKE